MFALDAVPVKASSLVIIGNNHTGWIDDLNRYVVSGEVENVGDAAARNIVIAATFYNSSGDIVANASNYAMLEVLLAGRKSGFAVTLFDAVKSAKVHHYTLDLTFSSDPQSRPQALEILSANQYTDGTGMRHGNGTVKNTGSQTGTYVYVMMVCYNETGYVVDTHYDWTTPENIDPKQIATFDISFVRRARALLTTRWTIAVESPEYEMIPEIPLSLFMFALFVVSACAILFGKVKPRRGHRQLTS